MKKMLKQNTTSLEKLYVKPKISKKFLVNFKITIRKGSSTQGRLTFGQDTLALLAFALFI